MKTTEWAEEEVERGDIGFEVHALICFSEVESPEKVLVLGTFDESKGCFPTDDEEEVEGWFCL